MPPDEPNTLLGPSRSPREMRLEADLRYARGLLRLLRESLDKVPLKTENRSDAEQAAVEAYTTALTAVDESGLAKPVGQRYGADA